MLAVTGAMDAFEAFIRHYVAPIFTGLERRGKDGLDVTRTFCAKESQESPPFDISAPNGYVGNETFSVECLMVTRKTGQRRRAELARREHGQGVIATGRCGMLAA